MAEPQAPMHDRDTIVAIATPPGRGGIGILRFSGPQALACALALVPLTPSLQPRRARFTPILDPETGDKLDEGIFTFFAAPHSYTGEDTVELAAHGSPVLLDLLVRRALARGARLARPGEFTERAFLSGRLDLTQAEGVRDLIEAQTLYQARIAAQQLAGALSARVRPIKDKLIALIAQMEAGIDFAEDDTPVLPRPEFVSLLDTITAGLQALRQSWEQGRLVHSSLSLALIGEPNVGKSSLFNRLLGRERAIVTAEAGTTRDLLSERLSLDGIPVELIDTAGLREAPSGSALAQAEQLGIARSREALAEADLVLVVLDATRPPLADHRESARGELQALLAATAGRPTLLALNKSDLVPPADLARTEQALRELLGAPPGPHTPQLHHPTEHSAPPTLPPGAPLAPRLIATSAATGSGLDELRAAMAHLLGTGAAAEQGGALLTNLRQYEAVASAIDAAERARTAAPTSIPDEMLLVDLYAALEHLDALTGHTTPDTILAHIFSTFCIGK